MDTEEGETYALRISHPTWRTDDELQTELHWLQALAHETTIRVPKLFLNTEGNLITSVTGEGVPEVRRAVLMSWIRGRMLSERLSPQNFATFGALAARLHEHAATWMVPPDLRVHVRNSLYVRGEEDELHERNRELFPEKSYAIFEHVRNQVQAEGVSCRLCRSTRHRDPRRCLHLFLSPTPFDQLFVLNIQEVGPGV